jgi:23S rRNA (guanine745-N1)-methyltransferase
MQLICPLCRLPLGRLDRSWCCENRHSFDIAKQGYCNLLPVQHKKSLQPGDSADMVAARSRFLTADYYQPISDAINHTVLHYLASQSMATAAIVDAGCGEGYYSSRLGAALDQQPVDWQMAAIDISKFAVLAAAKRNKKIAWYVANSSRIPIDDHSADVLLSLFSPLPAEEFYRCLKPGGLLLVATTGRDHLIELRQQLYEEVKLEVFDPTEALAKQFSALPTQAVQQTIVLNDNALIKDLFAMTPHYWRVTPAKKILLDELHQLTLSLDVQLHRFIARDSQVP